MKVRNLNRSHQKITSQKITSQKITSLEAFTSRLVLID